MDKAVVSVNVNDAVWVTPGSITPILPTPTHPAPLRFLWICKVKELPLLLVIVVRISAVSVIVVCGDVLLGLLVGAYTLLEKLASLPKTVGVVNVTVPVPVKYWKLA